MGVELGVTSVTSPGIEMFFGEIAPDFSRRLREKNDAIVYHNTDNHGYLDVTLTHEIGQANFVAVDTIYKPDYKAFVSKSLKIEKTDGTLKLGDV